VVTGERVTGEGWLDVARRAGGGGLGQRYDHLHVVDGKEASGSAHLALEPVLVDLRDEVDDVTLPEA